MVQVGVDFGSMEGQNKQTKMKMMKVMLLQSKKELKYHRELQLLIIIDILDLVL